MITLGSNRSNKLTKIDAIIVVVLIIIAGVVLTKAGYIKLPGVEEPEPIEPEEPEPTPPIPTPPTSIASEYAGFLRAVSPEDEGCHYDQLLISREWWHFDAILNEEDSELQDWTVTISFNHMAAGDLIGTLKPDVLVLTLNGPNGEEYGGLINKERGLGIISKPTLQAKTPGVSLKYEKSWAEGLMPEWQVHAEDENIDKNHDIIVDLHYFSPSDPLWTIGERTFQKSESLIASYVFLGCEVTGTIEIDGRIYVVSGIGHYEHSWSPGIVSRGLIGGWDWCYMAFDNGWDLYFTNYYPTPQYFSTKISQSNPIATLILTTDKGITFTSIDDIEFQITKSDERIFPFVKMPAEFNLNAKPSILQPFLTPFKIELELSIIAENTCEKVWKVPTYMGMKVGMSSIEGKISWTERKGGNQEVELIGTGTIWSMRALI
jgi:hypothetical protein